MTDNLIAVFITPGILVLLALWVPCLHLSHRCVRKVMRSGLPIIAIAVAAVLSLWPGVARGQLTAVNGLSIVAGSGQMGFAGDSGPATAAAFNGPTGIVFDATGNLYISDFTNDVVRRVDAHTGIITTIAGQHGSPGSGGDGGLAMNAHLNGPAGLALDKAGNLYIADANNSLIRKIDFSSGIITTAAPRNPPGFGGVFAIGFDTSGNYYIADGVDNVVHRVDAVTGIITTVAGNGKQGFSGDGNLAINAELNNPTDVKVDAAGNLFITDLVNKRIRMVTASTGIITTIAGNGGGGFSGDGGPAINAQIATPVALLLDAYGNLYVTDAQNMRVRQIALATGIITTVAGNGSTQFVANRAAIQSGIASPSFLALDPNGHLFVSDNKNNQILELAPLAFPPTNVGTSAAPQNLFLQTTTGETLNSPSTPASQGGTQEYTVGTVTGCATDGTTVNPAGTICTVPITFSPAYPGQRPVPLHVSTSSGELNIQQNVNFGLNGLGTGPLAALTPGIINTTIADFTVDTSISIAIDSAGNLYVGDVRNCVIYELTPSGAQTTVAGTSGQCYPPVSGLPATINTISGFLSVSIDAQDNLYIAGNSYAAKVSAATGILTVVAGTGNPGNSGDGGLATQAQVGNLVGVAVDQSGNLYLADEQYYVVRKVSAATGIITTVAGNGMLSFSGDNGPATAASLFYINGVALDSVGNLYISENHRVRRVDANTGIITTVAGNGSAGSDVDGIATNSPLTDYGAVVFDAANNFYIVNNSDIRKVEAATGLISTVAGRYSASGFTPPSGDGGPATAAIINAGGLAIDSLGNILVLSTDYVGTSVRKVDVSTSALIYPTTTNVGSADTADDPKSFTVSNIGNTNLQIPLNGAATDPVISSAWSVDPTSTCLNLSGSEYNLIPGKGCTFAVDFTPLVGGANTGTLVLTDDSLHVATATQTVTLSGLGKASALVAALSVSPTAISFPDTQAGGASASQTITVSSTGTATANITGITLTGANATSFSQTSNCGMTLASGSTCAITVTFTPQMAAGGLSATLSVASNDPKSPATTTLTGNGLSAGSLTISPTAQAFPSTKVGQVSAAQTSTISNTTAQAIYLSSGSLTDSADFIQSDNCGGLVGAGKTCTVSFAFAPQSAGVPLTSTYAIHDLNNPNSPLTVSLSGLGASAGVGAITLTPSAVAFTTTAGVAAAGQSVTLTNTGTAQVTLGTSPISIGGANATVFQGSAGSCGYTLAVGASCNASVAFTSTTVGTYTATFNATYFTSGTTTATASIPLSGTVTGSAQATLTPSGLSFTTLAGTAPATQTATLTNNGTAALSISSVALSGANAPSFSIAANNCGTTLAAGASCTLTLGFTATTVGSYSATLTVTDNASPTTQTVALTGTVTGVAQATLLPGTLTFTTVSGSTTAAQTATLANPGSAALAITSIGLTGANAALFQAATNTCGPTLAAGASCTIGITFSPTAAGSFNAALSVVDAVGTQTTALNGTANAPPLPPDFTLTATQASQSSYRGRSVTYTLQLASLVAANPFANPVTLSVSGLPSGVTASFSPASVIPGSATATSNLIVTIPALVGASTPQVPPGGRERWPVEGVGLSVACLLGGAMLRRRRRMPRLLATLLLCGLGALAASITGCGSNTTGFGVPTSASTLLVTGTSGATAHSTTVTLTIQ